MTWLLVPETAFSDSHFTVRHRDQLHYIGRVLRGKAGDEITVFDGAGRFAEARIESFSKSSIDLALQAPQLQPRARGRLRANLALTKSDRLELAIQKLAEIGVDEISLFAAARSVVKWQRQRLEGRIQRLQQIVVSAAQQSHRATLPSLQYHAPPLAAIDTTADLNLVFATDASARPLADLLDEHPPPSRLSFVIGPEGGFTMEELTTYMEAGFHASALGPTVLRAETAAVVAASLLSNALGRYTSAA